MAATAPEQAFINKVLPWARAERDTFGVPVSVAMGQAAMESGWGKTTICREATNYHGIKALRSNPYSVGVRQFWTTDWSPEKGYYDALQPFHVFSSGGDAFLGHGAFLRHERYADAFRYTSDPYRFLHAIDEAGYGGDGTYAEKVWALIVRTGMNAYDSSGGVPTGWSYVYDQPVASSNWGTSSWSSSKYGESYRFASPAPVSDVAWFRADLPSTGRYRIEARHPAASGYSTAAPFLMATSAGLVIRTLNQTERAGMWRDLGTYSFSAGYKNVVGVSRWSSAPGIVVADAVRITRVS
ncbi:glucosaminidase domain-containing protein [Kytococcus sedentarius]|uniref:golvesin C-terminal-like domain-containing protein n=1 Tax=Kytococcus sedentarius TaxID=1276 RepID=UPI00384D9926